ncbi:hypothetical protein VC83_04698 [Pseudogymnoascus destructans]|uniref:Rhodanese domain-containing protein n=1 Tax=Pseudogymnoascus destructans TaxID=655981 RepID=A0A177A897_9PEZI|nr:uncharacterized protein VC83_04698 [Pseudogymnoascus destructans]OAF57353.1 hypothetical protein VC83_04698 [Pseudogymnoascus destructans]
MFTLADSTLRSSRVMPEVPSNMQEGLAHLEVEANPSTVSPIHEQYGASRNITYQQCNAPQRYAASYEQAGAPGYQNNPSKPQPTIRRDGDMPLPSPFPGLQNPGPNVPLTDDQMEEELEQCREKVVGSNDPERQLRWAQDALLWSDIAIQSRRRAAVGSTSRPTTPNVERRIRDDALNITKFLAEQGHPKAEFLRAGWYEFGKFGFPEDAKESFGGYKRAAEKGYARAEYRIGTRYESSKDMLRAVKHYQNGVAQHDSASNYRMGMMALFGQHGQPQNYEVGVRQVKYAADTADENSPQGSYVYGMLLARELPNISLPDFALVYDLEQARHYVERAALLGFSKAQLKMGSAYELCLLGCEFNPTLSLHYNRLAASQGEPEAEMAISKWFLCGYAGVFDKNEEVAFTYAKRAAQQELPTAEFALGYFYEVGLHVPMDLGRSQEWYQKAADHGNTDAAARIDALRLHRTLSRKDHEQMAITRIRSQYGSRKGMRPDHLAQKVTAQQAPTLPVMSEERDDSSRPVSVYPPRSSSVQPEQPQFRVITPVPDPNAPLSQQQQPPFRVVTPVSGGVRHTGSMPSSPLHSHYKSGSGGIIGGTHNTAPYPENDVAHPIQANPNLRPLSGPPADRPNSAFGIKPLHPNHSFGPGQDPAHRPMSVVGDLQSQQRPHPGQGGRGQPVVPHQPKREGPTSNDWESQYRLPYSQPQGGDGRGKLQNQGAPVNKPHPQSPPQHGQPPQHLQPRNDYSQNRPNTASNERTYSAQAPLKPHAPGDQSAERPISWADNGPGAYPSKYSSIPPGAGGPAVTISPAPMPPQVLKPQAPPPKKGPQTFEEMGVPAASKDSECLVM